MFSDPKEVVIDGQSTPPLNSIVLCVAVFVAKLSVTLIWFCSKSKATEPSMFKVFLSEAKASVVSVPRSHPLTKKGVW